MFDHLLDRAVSFIPVLLSLTVHEWAHAWTAWKLGDDTARLLGRVSLNPIDHIDPVGTLLLPLLGVPFGWAKPVPINPLRFRTTVSMPMGVLLTALAGPVSNVLLAIVACGVLAAMTALTPSLYPYGFGPNEYHMVSGFLQTFVLINVLLASFNMLPIPPLDGSRIVDAMMPDSLRPMWNQISSLGPVLLAAVIIVPQLLGINIMAWPIGFAQKLLGWVMTL